MSDELCRMRWNEATRAWEDVTPARSVPADFGPRLAHALLYGFGTPDMAAYTVAQIKAAEARVRERQSPAEQQGRGLVDMLHSLGILP